MSLAARALVAVALLAVGFLAGQRTSDNAWKARLADADRAASTKLVRNVEIGIDAASAAITEKRAQENRYADLQKRYEKLRKSGIPLAVVPPVPTPPSGEPSSAQGITQPAAEPELSGAAVWMWNSALVGRADVPIHSCGADGADGGADPACARGTGLTLNDAWSNHTENAQSCARDRARYERLKAYLRKINR